MNEIKKNVFRVSPFLVSVDGPDGVGKSNFARVLAIKLRKYIDNDRIKLIKPSYFNTSPKSQYIGQKLVSLENKLKVYSKLHNSFFLAAMTINYRDVILPAIESRKIIILDSSEVRALAFMIDKGSSNAVKGTIERIRRGILTCGIQPKIRIILEGSPKDLYRNLNSKNSLDSGDPHGIREIKKRIKSYRKAIEVIRQLDVDGVVDWRMINVRHINSSLEEYLSDIIDQARIIPALVNKIY